MEELHLSETLQRYFSDIFLCCQEENSGMASLTKTIELIKSGNVPEDIITQIGDICWNQCTNNLLTKKQFFIILKLIAAYQSNMKITNELIKCNLDLPLPRFTIWNLEQEQTKPVNISDEQKIVNDLIQLHTNLNDYIEQIDTTSSTEDSEIDSDTLRSISLIKNNDSPEISSTASDSPTPTNSVQDRNWSIVTNTSTWHGLISEEQRQLLGTEEESSDKHSSDDEDADDDDDTEISDEIWIINREQRDYYTNQFRQLQPDLNKLIAGSIAREFFEKSRLPVNELRKIWQLADVTKDGALDLNEFNTAMHLVVLRRNHIELPDVLPTTLIPGSNLMNLTPPTNTSISPESEVITTSTNASTSSSPTLIVTTTAIISGNTASVLTNTTANNTNQIIKDNNINKEWTKFVDSPTNSSTISSPGPKPVNFDFQKIIIDKDSKILQPVPLRLTPECLNNQQEQLLELSQQLDTIDLHHNSPKKISTNTDINLLNSAAIIQRPQVKKINYPSGPGAIPPPPSSTSTNTTTTLTTATTGINNTGIMVASSSIDEGGPVSLPAFPPPKKEKPPPPPPRPFKTHGRSSSLDLNRLNNKYVIPPIIPPRISPNMQIWTKKMIHHRNLNDDNKQLTQQINDETEFANFDKQFTSSCCSSQQKDEEKYENVPDQTDNNNDNNEIENSNNNDSDDDVSLRVVIDDDDDIDGIFPGDLYEAERKKLFSKFLVDSQSIPRKHGAFEIYRKPDKNILQSPLLINPDDKVKLELFNKLQTENTILLRICQELSQELADVKQERIALKVQLEKNK